MTETPVPPASPAPATPPDDGTPRRSFLGSLWMTLGLVLGYGWFARIAGRYLYPTTPAEPLRLFVTDLKSMRPGDSLTYRTPDGLPVAITRLAEDGTAADFTALSSVCPHLGCRVHWEPQHDRFFCPCHNGAFDREGRPLEGPPKDANQSLSRFVLDVRQGMLFIEVVPSTLADRGSEAATNGAAARHA